MFGQMLDPDAKQLSPFIGLPVCLIMKDGSRKIGQLTACKSGRIILNGDDGDAGDATVSRKTGTRRTGRRRARKSEDAQEAFRPGPEETSLWGELPAEPFGLDPGFSPMARESVPLKSVESVLVL